MVNEFTQLINTMGFPIAMVIYFIWDKYQTTKKLTVAIENNTKILTKLLSKMNCDELIGIEVDEK